MKIPIFSNTGNTWLVAGLMAFGLATAQAQTTATYKGAASGGEWNTAGNWDTGAPPLDSTTNAFVGINTNVNYNLPMVATSFGSLTNMGILNVNNSGFNSASILVSRGGGGAALFLNAGAVMNITGDLGLCSNSAVSMGAGTSLTISGALIIGSNPTGGLLASTVGAFGNLTNSGGNLTALSTALNPGNSSIGTSCRLVISGGTNNLGDYSAQRSPGGSSAPPALGTDGLVISNGLVKTTSISIGSNAHGIMYLVGGTVTNSGSLTLKNATSLRPARFVQTGGLFVNTDPNLAIMNPSGTGDTVYSVTGGTNILGGIRFGSAASTGTTYFTNAAAMYLGSGGIVSNGVVTVNALLNSGGLFGAYAPWTNNAPLKLNSGTFTFQAADASGNPNNIYSAGVISAATGILNKTGAGTLTLGAVNIYGTATWINKGTLALDVNGSLASSPIIVGSNTVFDVSLVSGGYTLLSGKTLAGSGAVTGAVTVATGGIINPGSNTLTGILSFSNSVTETGNAVAGGVNHFDLSSNPAGVSSNDFINIAGDFNANGTNTVEISGTLVPGGVYPLIRYGGNFNTNGVACSGSTTNLNVVFTLNPPTGNLSNSVASKTIYLIAAGGIRGPANIAWVGNVNSNYWDYNVTTNWLNAGSLDKFLSGDTVNFTDAGSNNNQVILTNTLQPAATIVNATSSYTFTGSGVIGGSGSLTKNNSGLLSILTTNNYSGVTTINGGVLAAFFLTNGGFASAIGLASSDPGNLVISNGTFKYIGGDTNSTDRGATLLGTSSAIDIPASSILTNSGTLTGSGGLTKLGSGTLILSAANSYASTTVSNGTLQIDITAAAIGTGPINFAGGTLAMNVPAQPTYVNALNVVSTSTLISGGGANNIVQGAWTGSDTLNLTMSGTFSINGPMTTNFTGAIHLSDSSTGILRFNTGGNGNGSQQSSASATASFDLGNSTVTLLNRNGGATTFGIYDLGEVSGGPTTIIKGASNGGVAANASFYSIGAKNLSSTFAGTIIDGSGGAGATTSIIKVGSGILTLTGINAYTASTTISNGVLALAYNGATDGSINNSTPINVLSGAFLDVSGRSDATLPLSSGKTLMGNGTIRGNLNTTGGGAVSPGASAIGTLTVTNTATLGGVALMRIDRNGTPKADKLVATNIVYGGTLTVTNIGASLQAGDSFTLFSGAVSGTFSTVNLPNYYTFNTSQLAVNGSITVSGTYKPAFSSADYSALTSGSIVLNATNGAVNGPIHILTSTNLALPLGNWTTNSTTTFDGSGNLTGYTITVDPTLTQLFIALQVH